MTTTVATIATNLYPFKTKAQIREELEGNLEKCEMAIALLFQKQTEWEQSTSATKDRNRVGFMSSHAVRGSRIAKAVLAGEPLNDSDAVWTLATAVRYTRQLAIFAREEAMAEDPNLAPLARVFGLPTAE